MWNSQILNLHSLGGRSLSLPSAKKRLCWLTLAWSFLSSRHPLPDIPNSVRRGLTVPFLRFHPHQHTRTTSRGFHFIRSNLVTSPLTFRFATGHYDYTFGFHFISMFSHCCHSLRHSSLRDYPSSIIRYILKASVVRRVVFVTLPFRFSDDLRVLRSSETTLQPLRHTTQFSIMAESARLHPPVQRTTIPNLQRLFAEGASHTSHFRQTSQLLRDYSQLNLPIQHTQPRSPFVQVRRTTLPSSESSQIDCSFTSP